MQNVSMNRILKELNGQVIERGTALNSSGVKLPWGLNQIFMDDTALVANKMEMLNRLISNC